MANININDLFELEPQEMSSSYIKSVRQDVFSHQVSFDKPIGEPSMYRELINLLYMADESTEFNFLINTPGGGLSAVMAVIEAIKGSEVLVRGIITGEAHSAGSLLVLNCHEIVVTDSAHMLVHTCSYGVGGNAHMVQGHVDFSTKMVNKLLDSTYSGFLSVKELEDVKRGIEYWFDADEIRERLKGRFEYLKEQKELEELATQEKETKAAPKKKSNQTKNAE